MRWLRHLFDFGRARRQFPARTLAAIQQAIAASEARHAGEIVFAVEGSFGLGALLRGRGVRERAHEVFAQLQVWNTQDHSGVLIYVLLAERAIEIVADRGIAARVDAARWQQVCELMRERFATGDPAGAALAGIAAVSAILAQHLPATDGVPRDELPDRPVLL